MQPKEGHQQEVVYQHVKNSSLHNIPISGLEGVLLNTSCHRMPVCKIIWKFNRYKPQIYLLDRQEILLELRLKHIELKIHLLHKINLCMIGKIESTQVHKDSIELKLHSFHFHQVDNLVVGHQKVQVAEVLEVELKKQ